MFKIIGELVFVYILYKVIFDFVIPLYNTTKQMKGKMTDFNAKMQEQQRAHANTTAEPSKKSSTVSKGDYIDYEDVK
ncbi:MAG: hypothetical protein ABL929_05925 [Ferruginibacter sp.]|nr:hypothetical protein [Ferruginibacter sp.]